MHALGSAQELLRRAKSAGAERVLVALSGGKDSLVSLDLCVKEFGAKNVVAWFMYFVPGLAIAEAPVRAAAARHGIELLTIPHWDLPRMFKFAVLRKHIRGTGDWRDVRLADVELLVRARTGIDWIVYGHRADESLERRGMIKACDGCDEKRRRVYPLRWWKGADSYAYLRMNRIPVPSTLGGFRNSGIDVSPECLHYLREHHPADYRKICNFFPFAEAALARAEMHNLPLTAQDRIARGRTQKKYDVVAPSYRTWSAMLQRCHNPKYPGYERYGGAGVTVCERWRSYEAFIEDMGERPEGANFKRLDDSKPFEPGNCKWTSREAAA